jgi:folate-binding protein YgfZ
MVSDRDFEPVWNVLMKAGATPVGLDALEARRIAAGIPGHPNELGEHSGPLEAGGMDGITDGKGCYPGQEVIERTLSLGRPPRVLVPVELGSHGEVGVLTGESEKSTGELTSVVTLPDGSVIGLALVKQAALAAKQWYRDGVSVRPRGED